MARVFFALHDYSSNGSLDGVLVDQAYDPFWHETDYGYIWDDDWKEIAVDPERLQEIVDAVISECGGKEDELYFPVPLHSLNIQWSLYAREPHIGDYDFVIEGKVAELVKKNEPTVLSSPTWTNCFDGAFRDSAGQTFRLSPSSDKKHVTIRKWVPTTSLDDGYELASEVKLTSEQVKYIVLLINALKEADQLRF
jgi:hypothetical protein